MASPSPQPEQEDIHVDPNFNREESDTDSSLGDDLTLSTASVNSSIYQYRKLNGRTYHNFNGGEREYWAPNDDAQNDQLDLNHHIVTLALEGKLFLAPLKLDAPIKVLDVGTGTGIWAMDFADAHPEAEVTGIDLSPIQPTWTPPNCKFELDDATKVPWTFADNSFDYVHIRYMIGCFPDWPAVYREAYRVLKPGGWLEHMDCAESVFCDDGSIPDAGNPYKEWAAIFEKAGRKMGQSFLLLRDDQWIKWMGEAGWKGIQRKEIKTPVGGWAADPRLKEIGLCNQLQFVGGLDGLATYILVNALGWTQAEATAFLDRMKAALRNRSYHGYCRWGVAWVQKPLDA